MTLDRINRATWSGRVVKWFERHSGWTDPGEERVVGSIADQCAHARILDLVSVVARERPWKFGRGDLRHPRALAWRIIFLAVLLRSSRRHRSNETAGDRWSVRW